MTSGESGAAPAAPMKGGSPAPLGAYGPEVAELLGVHDRVDRADAAALDVEPRDVDHTALRVHDTEPGLAVDVGLVERDAPRFDQAVEPYERAGDRRRAVHRLRDRARPAAPVADEDRVLGEDRDEALEVALPRCGEEARRERVAGGRVGVEARRVVLDPSARAAEDLAAVVLAALDDPRDLGERHVEGIAQDEHGALDRREALEQHQKRERHALLALHARGRVVLDERLGQPRADVRLAAMAGRAQDVDRQARGDGRQERALGLHVVRRRPAQERLLHDVLGLGDAPEHPVGDREQEGAKLVRCRCCHCTHTVTDERGCHSVTGRLVRGACTSSSPVRPEPSAAR
jgi:hypothetical protein